MAALDQRDVRRLTFGQVELDWWTQPWLNVADRDRPFTKKAHVDLDPVGGPLPGVQISIGGDPSQYVVIENMNFNPSDAFSQQNTVVETYFDDSPLNRWRQIDRSPVYPMTTDAELWTDRLFTIPPGRTLNVYITNLSPLGRSRFDVEIKGWISRMAN